MSPSPAVGPAGSLTRARVRELDRRAIEDYGLPGVARKAGFDAPGAEAFTGLVHVLDIGAPRRLLAEFGIA